MVFQDLAEYFGANSRGAANHSKSLGWKPTKGATDMLASFRSELEILVAQNK